MIDFDRAKAPTIGKEENFAMDDFRKFLSLSSFNFEDGGEYQRFLVVCQKEQSIVKLIQGEFFNKFLTKELNSAIPQSESKAWKSIVNGKYSISPTMSFTPQKSSCSTSMGEATMIPPLPLFDASESNPSVTNESDKKTEVGEQLSFNDCVQYLIPNRRKRKREISKEVLKALQFMPNTNDTASSTSFTSLVDVPSSSSSILMPDLHTSSVLSLSSPAPVTSSPLLSVAPASSSSSLYVAPVPSYDGIIYDGKHCINCNQELTKMVEKDMCFCMSQNCQNLLDYFNCNLNLIIRYIDNIGYGVFVRVAVKENSRITKFIGKEIKAEEIKGKFILKMKEGTFIDGGNISYCFLFFTCKILNYLFRLHKI